MEEESAETADVAVASLVEKTRQARGGAFESWHIPTRRLLEIARRHNVSGAKVVDLMLLSYEWRNAG